MMKPGGACTGVRNLLTVLLSPRIGLLTLTVSGLLIISLIALNMDQEEFRIENLRKISLGGLGKNLGMVEKPKLRIICLLTTCPKYHNTRAKAVMDTWGKRCDYIYFVTTKDGKEYPHLNLIYADLEETYDHSWGKMKVAFKFAYENFFDKVDWIVKMDDDSYMIAENMLKFLEDKDTNEPVIYGRHYKVIVKQGYVSGGSGYALSKRGLELLVTEGIPNATFCPQGDGGYEDVHVGKCLEGVGGRVGNTTDGTGEMFHPLDPQATRLIPEDFWLYSYSKYPPREGLDCCSTMTIAFHYISPDLMFVMELLLYKIKVVDLGDIVSKTGQISEALLDGGANNSSLTLRQHYQKQNKLMRRK